MVHDTDIVELELKSKKFSLAVRKKEALKQPEPLYQVCCTLGPVLTYSSVSFLFRSSTFLSQAPPQMPPPQYGMPPPAQAAAPPAPAPSSSSTMPSAPSPAPAAPSEKPKAEGVEVRLFCLLVHKAHSISRRTDALFRYAQVSSPMSGTFYRSPAPGEPPFVNMGDRVEKGQTIGIIEAMKLMNEIEVQTSTASSLLYHYDVSGLKWRGAGRSVGRDCGILSRERFARHAWRGGCLHVFAPSDAALEKANLLSSTPCRDCFSSNQAEGSASGATIGQLAKRLGQALSVRHRRAGRAQKMWTFLS